MGVDAFVLLLNLITGIVVARALGPSGRGEIAAILVLTQLSVWFFSGGAEDAITFRLSRHPADGARLLGTWMMISLPLSLMAIVAAELALPLLFSAQTEGTIHLARIYVGLALVMMLQLFLYAMLLGSHDFRLYNVVRVIQPALIGAAYITLWATSALSVEMALVINAAATSIASFVAGIRSLRRHGFGRPSAILLRKTVAYGLRAHLGSIAGLVNARLDLLIIPAFLGAASVGLYSVAANVTSVIVTLTATIRTIVLPVATRDRQRSSRTVIRTLHAVLLICTAFAIPLGVLANVALNLVYGGAFEGAATSLRILLPGVVLDAAAMVLWAGMLALNRPFMSSVAAAPAAVLTVVGLILFLESGGIEAAAIVSTCAYTVVFAISVLLYKRVAHLQWREFLTPPVG